FGGKIPVDKQREDEYTHKLGKRIVEEFHKINRVVSSHRVAYTACQMIKKENDNRNLFDLLRRPDDAIAIPYEAFKAGCQRVLARIFELAEHGKLCLAPHLRRDLDEIIAHGLANVGMYHAKRPLIRKGSGEIVTEDLNLLYFYHNRLDGYAL